MNSIFISSFSSSFFFLDIYYYLLFYLFVGGIKGGDENLKMDIKNQTISKASFSEGLHRLIRRIKSFSQFFGKFVIFAFFTPMYLKLIILLFYNIIIKIKNHYFIEVYK